MSHGGQLLAELGAKAPQFKRLAEVALHEARVQASAAAEANFRAMLTGTEGMSTESLALWERISREYCCGVWICIGGNGWSCRIHCPDTDVTGVGGFIDPESALRACVAAWWKKVQIARPTLKHEAVPC